MFDAADSAAAIAGIRADEARLPAAERLFTDPYAALFRGRDAAPEVTARLLAVPYLREQVRLRTRFIDDTVRWRTWPSAWPRAARSSTSAAFRRRRPISSSTRSFARPRTSPYSRPGASRSTRRWNRATSSTGRGPAGRGRTTSGGESTRPERSGPTATATACKAPSRGPW